jgi:lipid II:glycine glycyltransferase (peptidoglycan interpeptide bridge formation enzyme)
MSIAVVRSLPESTWRRFVDEHPAGNIFHTPEMFRVFACTRGHQPGLWAAADGPDRVLALMLPVEVTLVGGPLRPLTTRAIVYGGVLCAPGTEGKTALGALLRAYKQATRGSVLFTELRNLSDVGDLQAALAENGFTYEGHLNYLIDLNRPVEELLQSIGSRTRKKIRKGLREESVQVVELSHSSELDEWYRVLQQTYHAAQVPLADRSLFEAAFEELRPRDMARFTLAKVNGAVAACSVELLCRDTMYGWYGGVDRSYSAYLPNEMLMWHILAWGASHGYRVYDFGGAGRPGEEYGVRDFKAKFGGDLVNFGRSAFVHAPLRLKLSQLGYRLYQRV